MWETSADDEPREARLIAVIRARHHAELSAELRAWIGTLTHVAVSACVAYVTLRSIDIDPLAGIGRSWAEWRARRDRLREPANPTLLERMRDRVERGEFSEFPQTEESSTHVENEL